MALTQITTGSIADDAVTTDKLANAINTARDANTAKTTNATHSGEVTGATALTIADNVVDEANLKVSNSPTNGYSLSAQSGNTGGLTWAAVNTDLSNDSSPQLGGDLASNGNDILMADSDSIKLGTGNDLLIYHDGSNSYIQDNGTGDLFLQSQSTVRIKSADEDAIKCNANAGIDLYYNDSKTAWTTATGFNIKGGNTAAQTELQIYGNEGRDAEILLAADDGDDNADYWKIISSNDNSFYIQNYTSGSYETSIKAAGDSSVELYHDNVMRLETANNGIQVNNSSGSGVVRIKGYGSSSGGARYGDIIMNQDMTIRTVYSDHLIFNTNQTDRAYFHGTNGHFLPNSNNTYDLGSSSQRWRNVYANDLQLSNEAKKDDGGNDVDGTWGDWTLQEGESNIFMINNRSGKKFKIKMEEV